VLYVQLKILSVTERKLSGIGGVFTDFSFLVEKLIQVIKLIGEFCATVS
jgi:hypothetical protein